MDRRVKMGDEFLCIITVDKSWSGKVDGNCGNRVSNIESFIVKVMSNLKAIRKRQNGEELPRRHRPGRLLNVLCTFNLRSVSAEKS